MHHQYGGRHERQTGLLPPYAIIKRLDFLQDDGTTPFGPPLVNAPTLSLYAVLVGDDQLPLSQFSIEDGCPNMNEIIRVFVHCVDLELYG